MIFFYQKHSERRKGWWSIESIATWSTWLTKIKITSRQNPPHKQGGQNQSYHPHRKYEEVPVTVTFVWTMSVYTPRSLTCSPWKVSIPQKTVPFIPWCFKHYVKLQGCKPNLFLEVGTSSAFSRHKWSKRSQVIGCNKHQDLHSERRQFTKAYSRRILTLYHHQHQPSGWSLPSYLIWIKP